MQRDGSKCAVFKVSLFWYSLHPIRGSLRRVLQFIRPGFNFGAAFKVAEFIYNGLDSVKGFEF